CLWRREARRARDRPCERAAPAAHGRTHRRHGAARAQRTDCPGEAPGGRAQDFGTVYRTLDGRSVRLCGPDHRSGTRRTDCRGYRRGHSRQPASAAGLSRHRPHVHASCRGAGMSAAMLEVERLRVWYGAAQILFEPSFHVGHGEVVALMGRNGAGKSTTLKALMALIPHRSGTVRFLGEDISRLKPFEIARRGLGFVPEDRRIFSDLTVLENLEVGRQPLRHHRDGRPTPAWTPEKLFTIFPNLRDMPDRRGAHMSGGEQQMLTVARTLMGNPLLVLLDEPSEGVAPVIVEQMANTIVELKKEGLSVLLSE